MEQADTSMETVIRGWIGEDKVEDQRRTGQSTAQVQRLQQMRGAAAGATVPQPAMNLMDARLGKPPVFRGDETKGKNGYFKFRSYRTGDSHRRSSMGTLGRRTDPGLAKPVSDPGDADGGSGTPYRARGARINGAEALRLLHRRYNPLTQERMLAKLNEVLQVDLGTDERTYMDTVDWWEQRIHEFETMSRKSCRTS